MKNYQSVNQYGMADEFIDISDENSDLSEFMFRIRKTAEGVSLKGEIGSAWATLSFTCTVNNCGQAINQFGMTSLETD